MVSYASIKASQQSHISALLPDHPVLVRAAIAALDQPPLHQDYQPSRLEVHFNGRLVLLQEAGITSFEAIGFAPTFRPKVIALYGDSELLFVRYQNEVLINRLPHLFTPGWTDYGF